MSALTPAARISRRLVTLRENAPANPFSVARDENLVGFIVGIPVVLFLAAVSIQTALAL